MKEIKGIGSSEGIIIGTCYLLDRENVSVMRRTITEEETDMEIERLSEAFNKAIAYMEDVKSMSMDDLSESHSLIFDVYLMLLKDETLAGESRRIISENLVNAEYALNLAGKNLMASFEASNNEYLRERKNDIHHIVQKVLRFLTGHEYDRLESVQDGAVVVAHDLSPSDTTHMVRQKIKGFATDLGSRVSHTSILAKSLGLPAVVGIGSVTEFVQNGETVIIDGFEGLVIVNPDEETLEEYRRKEERYHAYIKSLEKLRDAEVKTLDERDVFLYSNIELNDEIYLSTMNNAAGIGLYRTEYIYLQHGDVSEEKQFEILKEAVELNNGKPITVRTFDLGGEKLSGKMPHPDEQNPVLGLRAIRYSLRFREFFIKQMRAIMRSAVYGDVKVMFPMISGMDELLRAKEAFAEAAESLRLEGADYRDDLPLGVMMELPSLAIISDMIAKEVDFMSVGTNDLIQYTLGIDRNNEYVAYLYRPAHPAVLNLLFNIIESAKREGVECSVCGEIAGEPKYIPILLGLGYRHLSMSPAHILKAKKLIKQLDTAKCRELVEELKTCRTSPLAEEMVMEFIKTSGEGVYFS
ncbi:phosphoenolpyruvate--protein phosphotransferase [Limisalsivibrio acetivorans]|uniref:phosphoenolpyruvate--protein phosphotransferase n=1 Tax=Limisalsivibrio acetivorans TaxID=1304888 RepID=UPI0003B73682|nr:phosphoenolpyruvate--protein phosphotransferase [Limisalsivibrio acetivorans]